MGRPACRDGGYDLWLSTAPRASVQRCALSRVVLERMLAGVSCRRYPRTQEPVGAVVEQGARSTSKSAVSRAFVERTRAALAELMGRRLDDVRLAVLMLDGIELKGRTNIVALGNLTARIELRLLALAACISLNHQLGRPSRAIADYTA